MFKQKTAYEMRISDWSSDVCSSDLGLTRAEAFSRVEAPDAGQQALTVQDLVAAGDAAVEVVGDIEEGGVAVGDPGVQPEQLGRDRAGRDRGMDAVEQDRKSTRLNSSH